MSEQRVNKIAAFNGTSPSTGITPTAGDNSTQLATTEFVAAKVTNDLAAAQTISGDKTFTGDVDLSDATLTMPPSLTWGLPIFPSSMGIYDSTGQTGTFAMTYQSGNTFTASRNETGSVTLTLTDPMSSASSFVVLPVAAWKSEVQQLSVSIQYISASQFTIVVEADDGVNVDTEVRFMIFGNKA